ncbi:MAG: glycosyltransferase [Pseudomonadales bacterium]|nr:glycosyltransferase [Pseudomonadales bacterium]
MNAPRTRILIVVSNLEYGGAQRQIVELVNNIDLTAYDVHIASLSDYVPLSTQVRREVPVHITLKKSRFDFSVVFKLLDLVKQYDFQILHGYLFDAEIATRLAGFLSFRSLSVIGAERNTNYTLKRVQYVTYKLTNSMFDVIIANSQSGADFNSKLLGLPEDRYRVIYNGIDTSRFKPLPMDDARRALDLPADCVLLGVFASFKQQKNHPLLFDALLRLGDRVPNLKILLVGDMLYGGMHGSDEYHAQVMQTINTTRLKDMCILLGNRDDVESVYPACDFTVLPSLFEGTPNVVLESMACGVPTIATRVSDNDRIVVNGETGYIVGLDAKELSVAIEKMAQDKSLRTSMGEKSRQRIIDHFSSERLAENTARIYDELIPRR